MTAKLTLGLGTIVTEGYGTKNPEGFASLLQRAATVGVTNVDTAASYGGGESERLLGRWMKELGLSFSVSTKIGIAKGQLPGTRTYRNGSPEALRRQAEESLQRLQRDKVEWLLLHHPDPAVPVQLSMEGLIALREEGLADKIGFSNLADEDAEALISAGLVDVVQYPWSLLDSRRAGVLSFAGIHGVERFAFGVLAFGILAGSMRVDTLLEANDWRSIARSGRDPGTTGAPLFLGETLHLAVKHADEFASKLGSAKLGLAPAAVSASLAIAPADHVIVGCRTAGELDELVVGIDTRLPASALATAREIAII